jgi:hypothetical protein
MSAIIVKRKRSMKEVYYKGQPYQYRMTDIGGKRHFQLYQNGVLRHCVEQGELDIRSIVSFILDSYYRSTPVHLSSSMTSQGV